MRPQLAVASPGLRASWIVVLALVFLPLLASAQLPFECLTPDPEASRRIAGQPLEAIDLVRYEVSEKGITLDPRLPADWTWIAGRRLASPKGRIDFFFLNGYFFSNSKDIKYVNFRSRVFPNLFTDRIESNAFVIGFQKEDVAIVFAAVNEPTDVVISIPADVLGKEMVFNFPLRRNEAKLLRLTRKAPPYLQ